MTESHEQHSFNVVLLEHRLTLLEAAVEASDRALLVQAREYERRLADLNHAHELAKEAAALTVPRETFDRFVFQIDAWKEEVTIALARSAGAASVLVAVALSVVSLGGVILTFALGAR